MKYTDDVTLMHDFELVNMRNGNPYNVKQTPCCKDCGTYWLTILRSTKYSSMTAAREVCPKKDPERRRMSLPSTPEEILADIQRMQHRA